MESPQIVHAWCYQDTGALPFALSLVSHKFPYDMSWSDICGVCLCNLALLSVGMQAPSPIVTGQSFIGHSDVVTGLA